MPGDRAVVATVQAATTKQLSTADPATYPSLQPVIAYDFENVNTLAMRGSSGARFAGLVHEPSRMIWS